MPESGTPEMRRLLDELATFPDAKNMFSDRLLELVKFTTVDGGESAEQVGRLRKTHHNVYWDHARRRFVALPCFPENPQSQTRNLFWWKDDTSSVEARISQKVNAEDGDNYIYIDSASSHAEALFLQLHYYCHHDIAAKPESIDEDQMERGKIGFLYYHPARTTAQYESFLRQFLPESLPRKRARLAIDDMVYVYQMLQPLVYRVIYESATSMILSPTLGERFMLPCSLLAYETKLGKQTIASLSTDKERSKLLRNWARAEYSLEKPDSESSSEDADDSGPEDEFQEILLSGSEDDDEDKRLPPKAPKGKTKKLDIRLSLQRSAVRWTAVTDEAGFQAQAGSDYEEYVEPRAPKAGHAGASTSSMLSPIKETGERRKYHVSLCDAAGGFYQFRIHPDD
eukprot:4278764-Pleurochrysis_carterae.AAC.1